MPVPTQFSLAIPIYQPLMTTLGLLGGAAIASGLLMVGSGLQLGDALKPTPAVLIGTVAKLLITPAIVCLWSLATGLRGIAFVVAIVCAAVPTAMNGYVLARQLGGDAPMLATTTTLQTFLSAVTVPALIWLAQLWRG